MKIFIVSLILWAVPAYAIPICYRASIPTVVSSIGKSVPDADELCFNHSGVLVYGMDTEFYAVVGGILSPKLKVDVDVIKANRVVTVQAKKIERNNARADLRNDRDNGVGSTLPEMRVTLDNLLKLHGGLNDE